LELSVGGGSGSGPEALLWSKAWHQSATNVLTLTWGFDRLPITHQSPLGSYAFFIVLNGVGWFARP
jgi:hypothetical protein